MMGRSKWLVTALIGASAGCGDGAVGPPGEVRSVAVSPSPVVIELPGQTRTLAASAIDGSGTAVPDQTWQWQSSDAAVAVVDDAGLVTATGIGNVTITASTSSISGSAEVRVTGPTSIAFLSGDWTVTHADQSTSSSMFRALTGGIREEIRTRNGVEVLRALTRVGTDRVTWSYARADSERGRMQYFTGRLLAGQPQTVATTGDVDTRLILEAVSTAGFTIRIQTDSSGVWTDQVMETYRR